MKKINLKKDHVLLYGIIITYFFKLVELFLFHRPIKNDYLGEGLNVC